MMRPLTWLCLFAALGSGLFLYQTKHRAQLLDREITQVMKQADAARARSAVLAAEYQLLSDPQRLGELTGAHSRLRPTTPDQFTTWAELERRLPPVGIVLPADGAAQGEMLAFNDLPVPPIPPALAPAAAAPATPPASAPAPAPLPTRAAVPPPVAAGTAVARAAPAAAPARPTTRMAAVPPTVMPLVSSVLATAPRSFATQSANAAYQPAPLTGSALGMARTSHFPSAFATALAATPLGGAQ